jgi:phosphonate transport system substrate-binding protein
MVTFILISSKEKSMSYKTLSILVLAITLLILAACGAPTPTPAPTAIPTQVATAAPTAAAALKSIVLADIGDDPAKRTGEFQPLADYLAAGLKEFGIGEGRVKVAKDFDTMIKWLKEGEVDLYFDSPFPTFILAREAGAQPLLRRWRSGVFEYHSVIFTKADSSINSVEDLKGKMVAYDSPYSTSGFLLPTAYLLEKGLNPVEKPSPTASVAADEVGYVFSFADDNVIQWVISDKAGAGAVAHTNFEKLSPEKKAGLKVLARTENVPRQVVVVRAGLDPKLVEAIKSLLLKLDSTDQGKAILKKFQTTDKFDEFPGGVDTVFGHIRELYELTQRAKKETK